MSYLILARKYRPKTFEECIGQQAIVTVLQKAIETGRLAQAWLFCGPSGVGKTTFARILARCLSCMGSEKATTHPCGQCESCLNILSGESFDLLEIDGASNNRVDEVRQLQEHIEFQAQHSRFRIVLIDEVHMLSTSAFNALLKTLEEPPNHVKFIFATTEPERLPATVRARCQRFDFQPVSSSLIKDYLVKVAELENIEMEEGVPENIAELAAGSVRNALSLLDQLGTTNKISLESVHQLSGLALPAYVKDLCHAVWDHDIKSVVTLIDRYSEEGVDFIHLIDQWSSLLRQALEQITGAIDHSLDLPDSLTVLSLIYQGKFLLNLRKDISEGAHPSTSVLLAVAKLAAQEDLKPISELVDTLSSHIEKEQLEKTEMSPAAPQSLNDANDDGWKNVREKNEDAEIAETLEVPDVVPEEPIDSDELNLDTLTKVLQDQGNAGTASFLKDAKLIIDNKNIIIEVTQPFRQDLLNSKENRQALEEAVKYFMDSSSIQITVQGETVSEKKENPQKSIIPIDKGSGKLEAKIIDMFHGKKVE